jgi:hypothetical protein
MWKSERTLPMLKRLEGSSHISQIIIIDNNVQSSPDISFSKKILYLPQKENIYVNPAWNLGVKNSSENFICIMNDDVSFGEELFSHVAKVLDRFECIGVKKESYNYQQDNACFEKLPEGDYWKGKGWGCVVFLKKENWTEIPEQFKIWFGDNWILNQNKKAYQVTFKIETEMSTTSDQQDLVPRIWQDVELWQKFPKKNFRFF